jgi:hypothetical protein
MAALPALTGMSPGELDFFFEVPGLLNEEGALRMQEEYEVGSSPMDSLKVMPHIAGGVLRRRLKLSTLARIARSGMVASSLRKLYEKYPECPAGFPAWALECNRPWKKASLEKERFFAAAAREAT